MSARRVRLTERAPMYRKRVLAVGCGTRALEHVQKLLDSGLAFAYSQIEHVQIERVQHYRKVENKMYIVESYMIYLVISVAVTVWVATTLHRNGRVFLVDAFGGNEKMADSVNHLLVVGFCLINVGFVTSVLKTQDQLATLRSAVEMVSEKIGFALLVLGAMHFFNLYMFSRFRKRLMEAHEQPPIPADGYLKTRG